MEKNNCLRCNFRHTDNGNCTAVGGFCTAVAAAHCSTDISTLNGRTMLNTSRCGVIDARDVGKTVFLTREEAEKALEMMKDE